MIYSMTAFASLEIKKDWGNAVWEIRSVNQRYLETFFRLPEQFRSLENTLRESLRQKLTRGKIECTLRIDNKKQTAAELHINQELATQVLQSLQWLKQQAGEGDFNLTDVLRYPGVVEVPEQDVDLISQDLLVAFEQVVSEFIAMRQREGEKIHTLLTQRPRSHQCRTAKKCGSKMPEIFTMATSIAFCNGLQEVQLQPDPQPFRARADYVGASALMWRKN